MTRHQARYVRPGSMTTAQRFARDVTFSPTGCWLWSGGCYTIGYAQLYSHELRRQVYAHRWSYEHFVGPIPAGLQIDHLCRVRACVNPAHLEAVTHAVNSLRGVGAPAVNARKTHCKRGHPLSGDNLRIWGARRERACWICAVARTRAYYLAHRRSA